jgi:hypothetical protein
VLDRGPGGEKLPGPSHFRARTPFLALRAWPGAHRVTPGNPAQPRGLRPDPPPSHNAALLISGSPCIALRPSRVIPRFSAWRRALVAWIHSSA